MSLGDKSAAPSRAELTSFAADRSNWQRWGTDDQRGAVNLITPEKRVAAARLVRSGRTVSMSHPLAFGDPARAAGVHLVWGGGDDNGGSAGDWIGTPVHGPIHTHVDALNHFVGPRGAWNGKRSQGMFRNGRIRSPGRLWGSIEHWGDGIVTRGVLLDVPRYRGEPFVAMDQPVHSWELAEVARAQGITVLPGDALVVYCGREEYSKAHSPYDPIAPRAGLHASCLEYLRETDCSILAWDMGEYGESGAPMSGNDYLIHYLAIPEFGLALVDNALIAPVAEACAEERRYEFLFVMAPLRIADGTGSPVNPLAIF